MHFLIDKTPELCTWPAADFGSSHSYRAVAVKCSTEQESLLKCPAKNFILTWTLTSASFFVNTIYALLPVSCFCIYATGTAIARLEYSALMITNIFLHVIPYRKFFCKQFNSFLLSNLCLENASNRKMHMFSNWKYCHKNRRHQSTLWYTS